jgi:HlyD family secretion protein
MKFPHTWRGRGGLLCLCGLTVFASLALLPRRAAPVVLRVTRAQRGDLVTAVTATGTVQPKRTVDIKYDGQDFVEQLTVAEGQRVTRGQILARMNTQLLEHTRAQNQQIVERDEANLTLAAASLHRAQLLSEHQLLARADLDSAQAAYDALVHQRDADRQALQETDTQIERATLRAPLDGVVTQLYVHEGEMLGSAAAVTALGSASAVSKPTNVLMTLAQGGALEVWADVNAIDLGSVFESEPAQFSIDAFRPEVFDGRVRTIGLQPTVINNVTTYQVKVDLSRPDRRWRIGMPVSVMLRKTLAHDAVLVPLAALKTSERREAIRTIIHNECARGAADVSVRTVDRNTQSVAIQGVAAGDLVMLSRESITPGFSYQCQIVEFEANPTFDDLQFNGKANAAVAKNSPLVPGPKPKNVLQRLFGI